MNRKERNRLFMREWSTNHRRECRLKAKKQYEAIKSDPIRWAKRCATRRDYESRKRVEINTRHKAYQIALRKNNVQARIAHNLRTRLWSALDKQKVQKRGSTQELIGCSIPELVQHLEAKFIEGMSWNKRNQIHIDHIIPVSAFNLVGLAQQKKAFHYSNLQPLWASENMRKGNKLTYAK